MKLKKIALSLLSIGTLGLVVGCGNGNENGGNNNEGDRSLVIYSNSVHDERGEWLEETAREAGFELTVVDIGGGDLPNRLIAERNNPIADVVFGLNHMGFEILKSNNILEHFVPEWADEITEGLNDAEGYYHAIVQQAILMIYNTNVLDETTAPTDWPDLWENPEFENEHFIVSSLGGGTIRAALAGILVRYQDPNGVYGISDEGWEALTAFFNSGHIAGEGEDFFASLANESTPIATIWSSGIEAREEQFGVEVGIVSPEIGVPHVVEQIGIVAGTDRSELAQEFVNWFGSAEVQALWSQEFFTLPANTIAAESAPEAIQAIDDMVTVQDIDWEFVTEHIEYWVEKIELQILP